MAKVWGHVDEQLCDTDGRIIENPQMHLIKRMADIHDKRLPTELHQALWEDEEDFDERRRDHYRSAKQKQARHNLRVIERKVKNLPIRMFQCGPDGLKTAVVRRPDASEEEFWGAVEQMNIDVDEAGWTTYQKPT